MPTAGTWNVEWLDQNSQRSYPLSEEATLMDVTGTFQLPDDLIVDLVWPVHAAAPVDPDKFHLSRVGVFGQGVTITIAYDGTDIGVVTVGAGHERNDSYSMPGVGDFSDSVGKITIGELGNTINSMGAYDFDLVGGRLVPTVIRPDLRGVTGFVLVNGEDESELITGDVYFMAGNNCRITAINNPSGNPQIRIDAISGEGLNDNCDCANLPKNATPISAINGITPDANGNLTLLGSDCLQLQSMANGIRLVDTCSEACCGCDELKPIVDVLQQMEQQLTTLEQLAARLESSVTTTTLNVLAAKTGEYPCV